MVRWLVAALMVAAGLSGCGRSPEEKPAAPTHESVWSVRAISADLPSATQIGRLFPAHVAGRLDVGYLSPQRDGETECPGDFVLSNVKFLSGRWGSYVSPGAEEAYFRGEPEPTVFVYAFASPTEAKAGLKAVSKMVAKCEGTRLEEGVRVDSHPLRGLRTGYVGQRTRQLSDNPEEPSGQTEDFFTDVLGTKGNFLIETRIQDATSFAPIGQVNALAQLATRVAGESPRPRIDEPEGVALIDFLDFRRAGDPHSGVKLETPADAMQMKRVSAEFRSAMSRLLQKGDDGGAPCVPLRVQTYRTDGYARLMFSPCGFEDPGQYEVWAKADGQWSRVDDASAPEEFDCTKLEKAKVPLGIAMDWCVTGEEGLGTDYPRR